MNDAIDERITIDELRDKARRIGDMAVSEAKQVTHDRAAQIAVAGAALVFAAVAVAYYLGRRRSFA